MSYHATTRSNYFAVIDLDAFKAALAPYGSDVRLFEGSGEHTGQVMVAAEGDDGCFPTHQFDQASNDYLDVDFADLVSEHLQPGQVAVFVSAGADKLRYVSGYAIAIDHTGERVSLSLNNIYDLATAKFGVAPTYAQH